MMYLIIPVQSGDKTSQSLRPLCDHYQWVSTLKYTPPCGRVWICFNQIYQFSHSRSKLLSSKDISKSGERFYNSAQYSILFYSSSNYPCISHSRSKLVSSKDTSWKGMEGSGIQYCRSFYFSSKHFLRIHTFALIAIGYHLDIFGL